jgi:hypothetical protein
VFSTVPGAPVFVGKSPSYRAKNAKLGIDLDLKGTTRCKARSCSARSACRASRAAVHRIA